MRLTHAIALVSLFTAACGSPCRDRHVAFIAAGGPIGILAAALDQCSDEPQPPPEPIAMVPAVGLVEQTESPDMGSAPDMVEPMPDLGPPAPLACGPGTVLDSFSGKQFCSPDGDGDAVPDRLDSCPALASGQAPDPARRGCPAPRVYSVTLPPSAFLGGGALDFFNGTATSKAIDGFNWASMTWQPATLTSTIFFQRYGADVTNAVSFSLVGTADYTAPASRIDTCAGFRDNAHQDASAADPKTGNPNNVVCLPRRIMLCVVDMVSPYSIAQGESGCVRSISGGGGYWSAASAPIRLDAKVSSADFLSSDPKSPPSIELQVLLSGNVKLSDFSVVATVVETLR